MRDRLFLYYLKKFYKDKPRFKPYFVNFLGLKFRFFDPLAFYYEFLYIFVNQIYHFTSTNFNPFIIDGGGYIGSSTVYFKKLYPHCKILVFEPDNSARSYLEKNIRENKLSDVKISPSGLYNQEGEASFLPDNTDGGKIDENGKTKIKVTKLSHYINQEVDFLKLNIEGAERLVLDDLNKSKKLTLIKQLCLEWHSFPNRQQDLDLILSILARNGFRYHIDNIVGTKHGKVKIKENDPFYLLIYAKKHKTVN